LTTLVRFDPHREATARQRRDGPLPDPVRRRNRDSGRVGSGDGCLGDQQVSAGQLYRFERRYGGFSRAIGLPQGVSEDQISARYDSGELEVHVKKPEVELPYLIKIGNGKAAIGNRKTAIEGKTTKP
jgi:Hsp20/alpha crystallin family